MDTVVTIPVWGVVLSVLTGGLIGMVIVLVSLVVMNRTTMVDTPEFVKGMEDTTSKLRDVAEQYQKLNNKQGGAKAEAPPKPATKTAKKPSRPAKELEPEPSVDYSGVSIQPLTRKQYLILASRADGYEAYSLHEAADLLGVTNDAVQSWISKKMLVGSKLNGEQWVSAKSLLAVVTAQGAVEDGGDSEEYAE